jgi:putative flippase GtrA
LIGFAERISNTDYIRYLGGSFLCGAINIGILIGGDRLGIGYVPLSITGYVVGGTVGYFYHAAITFRKAFSLVDYARFFGGLLLGLPIWLLLMALTQDVFAIPMWIAAPLVTVLMLIYNFLSARLAILWRLRG